MDLLRIILGLCIFIKAWRKEAACSPYNKYLHCMSHKTLSPPRCSNDNTKMSSFAGVARLRKRQRGAQKEETEVKEGGEKQSKSVKVVAKRVVGVMFWTMMFAILIRFRGRKKSSFSDEREDTNTNENNAKENEVFTREELGKKSLHLSLCGEVFDLSGGGGGGGRGTADSFYGEGKEYSFFIGTDQTKGFLTGKREESNVDVDVLSHGEVLELEKWVRFYREGGSRGTYRKRGVLGDGWFYDENGKQTERGVRFWEKVEEAKRSYDDRHSSSSSDSNSSPSAPPLCRAAWTEERGGTVWCDSIGAGTKTTKTYPRLNAKNGVCECYEDQGYSDLRKLYENCLPKSSRCFTG